MICNKCNIEMEYYKPSSGDYYICVKCNKVEFPYNVGNTVQIDNAFSREQSMLGKDIN